MSKKTLFWLAVFLIAIGSPIALNKVMKRDIITIVSLPKDAEVGINRVADPNTVKYISPVNELLNDPFLIKSSGNLPLTVQFGTSRCFGNCPVYRILILYDGTTYFDGELYTLFKDVQKIKLSADKIDQLKQKIMEAKFFDMNIQSGYITDVSYNYLAVGWDEKSKSMTYIHGQDLPKELYDLQCFIHTIIESDKLIGVPDWTCERLEQEPADYEFSN